MGLLVDGVWQQDGVRTKDGHFIRPTTSFRNWVTADGSAGPSGSDGFKAEPGRYHLYVALSCPWAHRTDHLPQAEGAGERHRHVDGLARHAAGRLDLQQGRGLERRQPSTARAKLSEIYVMADPKYTGRVSVPVLWDKERKTIVNNESSEIIRMLNSAFDAFTNEHTDYYPESLRAEIDRINDMVYPNINNGVYRAGFATGQDAYELAFRNLFDTLDELEQILDRQRYLVGNRDHRSRLAAVLHADPFRRGLLFALQVQLAAHLRVSQPVELRARPLPGAGRGRDREPRTDQAALLPQPVEGEPDRHRAGGPAAGFLRAARSRRGLGRAAALRASPSPRARRAGVSVPHARALTDSHFKQPCAIARIASGGRRVRPYSSSSLYKREGMERRVAHPTSNPRLA